jgi:MFS family permease
MIDDLELADGNGHRSFLSDQILALAVPLAAVTYLDRVCIAQTAPAKMRDLSLTEVQMGFVFSAFTIAYAVLEKPSGAWGDRIEASADSDRALVVELHDRNRRGVLLQDDATGQDT